MAAMKRSSSWPSFDFTSFFSGDVDDAISTTAMSPTNQSSQDSQGESVNRVSDQGQGTLWLPLTDTAGDQSDALDSGGSMCPAEKTPSERGFPQPLAPRVPAENNNFQPEVQLPEWSQPANSMGLDGNLPPSAGTSDFQFAPLVLPQPQPNPAEQQAWLMIQIPLPQANPAVPCQQPVVDQGQNRMICQMGPLYQAPLSCSPASVPAPPSMAAAPFAAYSNYHGSTAAPAPAIQKRSRQASKSKKASKPLISERQSDSQPAAGRICDSSSQKSTSEQKHSEIGSKPQGNLPKPEIREKLSSGCFDNLCFMTDKTAEELCELAIVRASGFHREVETFLHDPDLNWNALALVRMPAYQRSINYGISDTDGGSNILGVVAIKSSDGSVVPLRISVGIWLQRKDRSVLRDIVGQVVLNVFGENPMRGREVRRNSLTLKEQGVNENTPVELQITCVGKDGELQPEVDLIDLKHALSRERKKSLKKILESSNLKLTGEELDFRDFAILEARRLKERPKQLKTKKDFAGDWLPGDLFKCKMSEQLEELIRFPNFRAELDGHIVVLLPSEDCHGSLDLEEDLAQVAVVDTRKRGIFRVPRKILHPVHVPRDYLGDKYKYPVLVKSGDTWQEPGKARLCMKEVGAEACTVEFPDGTEASVMPADLRYARDLRRRNPILADGQDAATVARSAEQASTILT